MADVPLVGWDVACTDVGIVLLEVNLSCNFFRGTFDEDSYFTFMDDYFSVLDKIRRRESPTTDSRSLKKD